MIFNTSFLGQSDTFWITACVLSLRAVVEGRMGWAGFWIGVSFAFKAQAAFLAPFIAFAFVSNRVRPGIWLIPLAVWTAAMLPAYLLGWPAQDLAMIYLRQAAWQPDDPYVSNAASWWTVFGFYYPGLAIRLFPIGYVSAFIAAVLLVRLPRSRSALQLLRMATWSAVFMPFLLPGMHERYFMLADILAFSLAWAFPDRRTIAVAVLLQLASAVPSYAWAFGWPPVQLAAPFLSLAAILILLDDVLKGFRPTREQRYPTQGLA
ncbi:hypothetical protein [Sphingomonas daechungensis]|uniref:hypothetical protein n=1 Tax=Sphingomonas daechungensis TaxID=1176646 RepID=UPI003CD0891F